MSEPEYTTAERIILVNVFTDAINASYNEDFLDSKDSVDWEQLAKDRTDEAWRVAKDLGYDWLKDEQFTSWIFGDCTKDSPNACDILIAGLERALEASHGTN